MKRGNVSRGDGKVETLTVRPEGEHKMKDSRERLDERGSSKAGRGDIGPIDTRSRQAKRAATAVSLTEME